MDNIIIDCHCDTAYEMFYKKERLAENSLNIDLKKQSNFKTLIFYAIFMDSKKFTTSKGKWEYFYNIYNNIIEEVHKNKNSVTFYKDKNSFLEEKKQVALLSVEGGDLIDNLCDIDTLSNLNIKVMTLTWNNSNKIAHSSMDKDNNLGLSEFGKNVIEKMNSVGMIPDLSHCSDRTFFEVLDCCKSSVFVTHSNSRALCNHPRNITDEMFRYLMKNKGVLGINFYTAFLGENATIDTIIDHIEHFLSIGGENNLAFGSDFDGAYPLPDGIKDFRDFDKIINKMITLNYKKELLEKITYKNALRVISQ